MIDAPTAEGKALAIAEGARACVGAVAGTTLLFGDDTTVVATDPPGAEGFALRDDSLELRRLFLHAIARFGEEGAVYLDRDRQRPFAGMSPMAGAQDIVLVPLTVGNRTLGVATLAVDAHPDLEGLEGLRRFCELATRLVEIDRSLIVAKRQ